FVRAGVVDAQNVWMVESRDGASFLLKPAQAVRVFHQCLGQDFDRNVTPQPRVPRAVNFAHSASTYRREDFVGTYFASNGESHFCEGIIQIRERNSSLLS